MIFGILFLTVLVRSSPMNSLGQYYYDYTENSPLIDPNLTPYDPSMSPNMTDNISPRRFKDLDKMIKEINPEFDSRKYWAYGCHCFALNDRPSSSMGRGKPVDELDTLCKKYKECQKCAQKRFGEVIKFFWIIFEKYIFSNVWPSWFLTIGHVLVKRKTWSNAQIVKIRVNVPPANVTNYLPNVFCSSRTVLNENIICSGQEEHQKDNLMLNEDANQLEIQIPLQIERVVGIRMDLRYFLMRQNKNAAKILL